MKYLALSLMLCALLSLSNAQCGVKGMKAGTTHCQDHIDKTWHPVGSRWRNSACLDCDCERCCAGYTTPRSFPDDCMSVFDPVACEYIVHRKDDPSVRCPIYGAVGK